VGGVAVSGPSGRARGGLGWILRGRLLGGVRFFLGFGFLRSVKFFGFVHSPAGALDVDDDGVMDHAIDDSGCNDGVSEAIAQDFEVDF
jgi:hypothetical protein